MPALSPEAQNKILMNLAILIRDEPESATAQIVKTFYEHNIGSWSVGKKRRAALELIKKYIEEYTATLRAKVDEHLNRLDFKEAIKVAQTAPAQKIVSGLCLTIHTAEAAHIEAIRTNILSDNYRAAEKALRATVAFSNAFTASAQQLKADLEQRETNLLNEIKTLFASTHATLTSLIEKLNTVFSTDASISFTPETAKQLATLLPDKIDTAITSLDFDTASRLIKADYFTPQYSAALQRKLTEKQNKHLEACQNEVELRHFTTAEDRLSQATYTEEAQEKVCQLRQYIVSSTKQLITDFYSAWADNDLDAMLTISKGCKLPAEQTAFMQKTLEEFMNHLKAQFDNALAQHKYVSALTLIQQHCILPEKMNASYTKILNTHQSLHIKVINDLIETANPTSLLSAVELLGETQFTNSDSVSTLHSRLQNNVIMLAIREPHLIVTLCSVLRQHLITAVNLFKETQLTLQNIGLVFNDIKSHKFQDAMARLTPENAKLLCEKGYGDTLQKQIEAAQQLLIENCHQAIFSDGYADPEASDDDEFVMVENPVENPDAIATHPELLQLTRLNQTQQLLPFTQGQLQMLKQIDVKCATQLASHMTASAIESLREAHRPGSPSLFRSSPPAAANTGMDDNRNERWFGMG